MLEVKQPEAVLFKTPVATAITAVIGLIVAAASLLLFVLDLLVTPEVGALIVSFVVCGVGLTTGLIVLRRLAPRREAISLSLDSGCVYIQPATRGIIPVQTEDCSRHSTKSAIPGAKEADLARNIDRPQSISRYKTPEGGGLIGLIAMFGMAIMLMIGSNFARQFLSLAVPAGGFVALVLYWARGGNLD
jgi:hypothetical protein